ncbi:MAG: Matrixin, partial [Bryobacterales bacterium]|nr:Matrixin [Bryobacterales bacterium]
QNTSLANVSGDGNNVIVFLDTPAIRSALGPSVTAVTIPVFFSDGTILDSDIIFNPAFSFSTTGAAKTYDIQSILTHELGHSLGANHSGIVGAAMYQFITTNSTAYANLGADDTSFVTSAYPAASAASYGGISGTLSLNGAPVRSALVNAIDITLGTSISALTSGLDGTYSMVMPPGNYVLFAQPLTGNVLPGNLYLTTADAVDTDFSSGFLGGNASPGTVAVTAGNIANGDFSPPASGTSTPINFQYFNTGAAGGFGDQTQLFGTAVPQTIVSGQTLDLVMLGPGLDAALSDANIMLLGPLTLKPGSVRPDAYVDSNTSLPFMRMTVTIAAVTTPTSATLIVTKNGSISSYTGGLILMPPPPPAI